MSIDNITDETFEKEVILNSLPVIVDFYAVWCKPCKTMELAYAETSNKYTNQMKFAKCDIEQGSKTSIKYKIYSVPTLIIFYKGAEIGRRVGAMSNDGLVNFINEALRATK